MPEPTTLRAELTGLEEAGGHVRRLRLRPQSPPPRFDPGQYLLIQTPAGGIPFSIASAPRELPVLEVHFQPGPGSDEARSVEACIERAIHGEPIALTLPLGSCGLPVPPSAPLLIVAAGTGVTQARSILREHLHAAEQPAYLYWGVRSAAELYLREELEGLATAHDLRYRIAVEADPPGDAFPGNVVDAVAADLARGEPPLERCEVLLCGSPDMVYAAVARLRPCGLGRARTRSDVFDYAPREDVWD